MKEGRKEWIEWLPEIVALFIVLISSSSRF